MNMTISIGMSLRDARQKGNADAFHSFGGKRQRRTNGLFYHFKTQP